jgi:small conductance mechanosensitive channel
MTKFRRLFLGLALLVAISLPASAQPLLSGVPAHPAPHITHYHPIAEQIQSLITGTPAKDDKDNNANNDDSDTEVQENIGTQALDFALNAFDLLHKQAQLLVDEFAAMPEAVAWYNKQYSDARHQDRWRSIGADLLVTVGIPLVAAILLELIFIPARNTLRRRKPPDFKRKLGAILTILGTRVIPILVFVGAALTLLDQNETQKIPRFVVLNVVYALAVGRIVFGIIRGLFAPNTMALRLLPVTTSQAVYAVRWLRAYSLVIIYGYFFVDVARSVHVPVAVITAFGNILGLALVIMTLVVIAQKRAFVATLLRGSLSAAQHDLTLFESLRLWFARSWHVLAMGYLIIGYLITALGVDNGFVLMLRGTIITLLILTVMRFVFHAIDRWGQNDTTASSALHHIILRFLMQAVIWALAILGSAAAWGVDVPALFTTPLGQRILGGLLSIGVTIVIVALIYETCNAAIERQLNRRDAEGKQIQVSARMRTLLPMLRTTVFIFFSIIVTLVVLSEVGFNIAPLLAGAGIFGVAIGFGSQTLVKDFLTGLFIVIENTIAIGDVVKIDTHSGVVEGMSIRTLRLRDSDGALHILPFSEVTKIINMTKDFAFAVVDVGVSYDADLNRVMDVIREVGTTLQQDPIFKRVILDPIEILGVEALGDSSITIRSRIRTRPGKQWDVRRMLLLKIKQRFDKEGIDIPFPTVTQHTPPPKTST